MRYAVLVIRGFGAAYGARLRELREAAGATQEQLSRELARAGVAWTRARVAQVEAGRGVPDLESMQGAAVALSRLSGGKPVGLADLLPQHGGGADVQRLRAALSGVPYVMTPVIGTIPNPRDDPAYGVVEDLVVKQVGDFPQIVLQVARDLYGHSGTEERAARAGTDPSPQKLGAMGRSVVKELAAAAEVEIERLLKEGRET